jgi:hypothetical protein
MSGAWHVMHGAWHGMWCSVIEAYTVGCIMYVKACVRLYVSMMQAQCQ